MAFALYVDGRGVPYAEYGRYRGIDIGRRRSPLAVAERGLWYWNKFLAPPDAPRVLLSYDWRKWPLNKEHDPGDPAAAAMMLRHCADHLLDAIVSRPGFLVWVYDYDFSFGTRRGWRSAHAQAVGMQALLRATEITGNHRYAAPLGGLLRAFPVPVERGGLACPLPSGRRWYEKMADAGNEQPKVLNGMLFALLGLWDVAARHPDGAVAREAAALAADGLEAALEMLPRFDLGDWSAYALDGRRASVHYHRIHVAQLDAIAALTGDARVAAWGRRFRDHA